MKQSLFTKETKYLENRLAKIDRFNSGQEKDGLLSEDSSALGIAKILSNITPTSEQEAYAFLIELRKISVSDILDLIVTCPNCNTVNNYQANVDDFLNLNERFRFKETTLPVGIFSEPSDIINNTNIDDLSIAEYAELEKTIQLQIQIYLLMILIGIG